MEKCLKYILNITILNKKYLITTKYGNIIDVEKELINKYGVEYIKDSIRVENLLSQSEFELKYCNNLRNDIIELINEYDFSNKTTNGDDITEIVSRLYSIINYNFDSNNIEINSLYYYNRYTLNNEVVQWYEYYFVDINFFTLFFDCIIGIKTKNELVDEIIYNIKEVLELHIIEEI